MHWSFSTCSSVTNRHTGVHVFTDKYFTKTQPIAAYCSTDCSNHGDVVDSGVAEKDAGLKDIVTQVLEFECNLNLNV